MHANDDRVEKILESYKEYLWTYIGYHFHNEEHSLCALCGNSAEIDTTHTAKNVKGGDPVGIVAWYTCPNGDTSRTAYYYDNL